ncbi:MAG: hypothetical protein ACRECD_04035, partial [Burkholderiaceae bacterium]
MNVDSMVVVTADRHVKLLLDQFVALAAAAFLLAPAAARAAGPAGSGPVGNSPVVTLERIPGSTIPRVVLTAKAAERLGIATGKVGEEAIVRRQMVSGLIIPPMDKQPESKPGGSGSGGFGKVGAAPSPQPAAAAAPAPKLAGVGFAGFGQAGA